jgi:hypothetical protein
VAVRAIANKPSELDRGRLGFNGVEAMSTGRPGYHATTMLKIYLYGYLNRSQSTRRLKREAHPMRAEFGVPDPLLIADSQHPQVHLLCQILCIGLGADAPPEERQQGTALLGKQSYHQGWSRVSRGHNDAPTP